MFAIIVACYLGGWAVSAIGIAWVAQQRREPHDLPPNLTEWSVLAGACWPVLLIAVAQLCAVAVVWEALHVPATSTAPSPDPVSVAR